VQRLAFLNLFDFACEDMARTGWPIYVHGMQADYISLVGIFSHLRRVLERMVTLFKITMEKVDDVHGHFLCGGLWDSGKIKLSH